MIIWSNKYPGLFLLLLIIIAFSLAGGWQVINYPPASIHQWRQADCAAYALNYYKYNYGFLHPAFYNLVVSGGRSVSEFPVFYYVAAKLFHLFGVHFWVLRGLTFLSYILGLIYLLRCAQLFIKRPLAPVLPVILLATTPYFYYYALNFLPNVPAISFSFAGLYYLLRYEGSSARKYLVGSTLFFMVSVMLKPTDGGLLWVAYLAVGAKDFVFSRRRDKRIIPILISAAVIGACLVGWYRYAAWYNAANNNTLNLLGIYPMWDLSKTDIIYTITDRMWIFWGPGYQHPALMGLLALLAIVYIFKWRSLDPFLKFFTLFLILGSICYSVLWFKAFSDHDYYQLVNVIAPTFLFITVLEWYYRRVAAGLPRFVQFIISCSFILLVMISTVHNSDFQHIRYSDPGLTYKRRSIFEVGPYLRKLGIAETDTIISIPDITPNVTLLACGNPGYSSFIDWDIVTIQKHQEKGAKFLVLNDSSILHNKLYWPYLTRPMGQFNDMYIFDLREQK